MNRNINFSCGQNDNKTILHTLKRDELLGAHRISTLNMQGR